MANKVTVYTTSTCPYCDMAKRFLKDNKVNFTEVNVQNDHKAAMEMVKKSGQMGVPVIEIDGEIIVGFDKEAILRKLRQK
jgi:glutaredoxin-like YruB-family protein